MVPVVERRRSAVGSARTRIAAPAASADSLKNQPVFSESVVGTPTPVSRSERPAEIILPPPPPGPSITTFSPALLEYIPDDKVVEKIV
jgi:hypothetical protein